MPIVVRSKIDSPVYRMTCHCGCKYHWQTWEAPLWFKGRSFSTYKLVCPECDGENDTYSSSLFWLRVRWYHRLWSRLFNKKESKTLTALALNCLAAGVKGKFTESGDESLESLLEAYSQAEGIPELSDTSTELKKEIDKVEAHLSSKFADWAVNNRRPKE